MGKKLAGTLMVYNGLSQGYCYLEAIKCLQALCDYTIVADCGSTDGTAESLKEIESDKTMIIYRDKSEWDAIKGRTKLAYFTNIAIGAAKELGYEWQINLQSDEIIHEDSFPFIKEAIEQPNVNGYWNRRINLWGNSQHYLDVGYDRLPVGIEIIRLTKTNFLSIDDAQSVDCQPADWTYLEEIRMYHMGFVRSRYVHTKKIKHMLEEVFLGGNDPKVEAMGEVFDPWQMGFSKDDVKPIKEPLPIFIQEWAKKTDEINGVEI